VLVNDMAGINIDEALISDKVDARVAGEQLVALQNGCICCSIREDLVREVRTLAQNQQFDYLLVESTGISVPLPVAATFGPMEEDASGPALNTVARLDTLVTVVDAQRFVSCVMEAEALQDKGLAVDEHDDRTVADLLIDQVEFADVLILNKTDLVSSEQAAQLEALLHKLNRHAKVLLAVHGRVPVAEVLATRRFDMGALQQSPGWLAEINAWEAERAARADAAASASSSSHDSDHDHSHHHHHHHHHRQTEAELYGIASFVYHAQRPFHPQRLWDNVLSTQWQGVLRTKGFFWLASRHDIMGVWQSAGGAWQGEPSARWVSALPEELRPEDSDASGWHPVWGDRCQQLVWIGISMDEPALRQMLDSCLLTDAEMAQGPEVWAEYPDPLPAWAVDGDHDYDDEGEWEEVEDEGEEAADGKHA